MLLSMINLERRGVGGREAADALDAISSRIRVLSRLQERLVRSHTEAVVSIKQFITDLCSDLKGAFAELRPVRINLEVENHHFPQERAVALGLIINEFVTNSLKYAFPEGRPGTVYVRLAREYNVFCLTVEDDGIGIDHNAKPAGTGLGQRLLRSMAAQLGGSVAVESKPQASTTGTLAVVRFPSDEQPLSRSKDLHPG